MPYPMTDLRGRHFGLLLAEEPVGRRGRRIIWRCRCACGASITLRSSALLAGERSDCGCVVRKHEQHGQAAPGRASSEYVSWKAMLQRCRDPGQRYYSHYGGRGITVCDRWQASFAAFLADMGQKPTRAHTIERVDNDGNYEPGNCRWATRREQMQNTRQVEASVIEIEGVRRPLRAWAAIIGIAPVNLRARIRRGWTGAELLIPRQREGRHGRRM